MEKNCDAKEEIIYSKFIHSTKEKKIVSSNCRKKEKNLKEPVPFLSITANVTMCTSYHH